MSLRTMERILLSTSLIFGLSAMGCGDGDDVSSDAGTKPMDSGVKDAGPKDSGPKADTGGDEEELPSMACGSNTCTGILLSEVVVDPCCVVDGAGKATDQCGLDSVDIKRVNSTSPFTGCVPKDVPKASDSAYCGEFWDQVEMGGKVNGGLDIKSGSVPLTFEGCCLPTGECGALIDTPRGQNADELNTHLGCVSFTRLSTALNGADAGAVAQPEHLPYCNSSTGSPLKGDETVTGKPKFVCGCGDGKVDEGKGTFPCFNNLPTTVCGADQPKAEELAMIPEFICGCTQASKLPCMVNVAAATCGTKQIDANSVELALVPVFICGEDTAKPSVLPTLKGVDPAVCGKKAVAADSDDLAGVPEFICGEMGNPDTSTLPKLRNLPATTCGRKEITADSAELAALPEFICGAEGLTTTPSLPVLRNVPMAVCGKKEITADSAELAEVPEFVCGAEGLTATPSLPVMLNVDKTVCGKKEITTDSAELDRIPVFICGAVGTQPNGLPQMANVETAVCGKKPITQDSVELDGVPQFICGATGNPDTSSLPKLRNLPATICGEKVITQESAELAALPVFVCGAVGLTAQPSLPVLRNVDKAICGTKPITQDSVELDAVPAFICGELGNPETLLPTLRNLPANICGEAAPDATTLAKVPEFICGCLSEPIPQSRCLRNLQATVCGTLETVVNTKGTPETTDDCLTGVPEYGRGCGAAASPSQNFPSCLRNAEQFFGCVDTVVDTKGTAPAGDDCLVGVPEYLRGCGESAFSGTPNCLPYAGTFFGCVDITFPQRTVQEHICGCGNALTDVAQAPPVYPCLSRVATNICGTIPVTISQAATGVLNSLCGCGDGVSDVNCVKNVPATVCGAIASCNVGTTCGTTCEDTNSDGILNFCTP